MSLTPAANLPPVLLTLVANLPPVSTTLVKLVAKFAAGVVDTGGKFDTSDNFAASVVKMCTFTESILLGPFLCLVREILLEMWEIVYKNN